MTDDRVEATARALLEACREGKHFVTGDGRIGEGVVAELLGYRPQTLADWRSEGIGPRAFNRGVGRHRVSYFVIDLAAWIWDGEI